MKDNEKNVVVEQKKYGYIRVSSQRTRNRKASPSIDRAWNTK